MPNPLVDRDERRWRSRPLSSTLLRLAGLLGPVAVSVAAAVAAGQALPAPTSPATTGLWWAAVFGVTTTVLMAAERVGRRLMPLVMLLELTMLFPAAAPSRLSVARRAGSTRQLRERLDRAREAGLDDEAACAAETILTLVAALQTHDRRTRGHAERVRVYTDLLARELKLPDADRDRLRWGALLHDIGKLTIPTEVLNKPGAPTDEEWASLREHPLVGARLCAPLLPWLGEWGAAIAQHHERYDGCGYPQGLKGRQIGLAARVVAVADAFEVMTAPRPYQRPIGIAEACRELARCAGGQFDPLVVRAFLSLSTRRLWLVMGPLAWLAHVPLVRVATGVPVPGAAAGLTAALALGGIVAPPAASPGHRLWPAPPAVSADLAEPGQQPVPLDGRPVWPPATGRPAGGQSLDAQAPHGRPAARSPSQTVGEAAAPPAAAEATPQPDLLPMPASLELSQPPPGPPLGPSDRTPPWPSSALPVNDGVAGPFDPWVTAPFVAREIPVTATTQRGDG